MDTLPLPPRPSLVQYRKLAKGLLRAARSQDPDTAVRSWAKDWLAATARVSEVPLAPFVQESFDRALARIESSVREPRSAPPAGRRFALADAQFLIARAHGFETWAKFATHLDRLRADSSDHDFEVAADAVVGGDGARTARRCCTTSRPTASRTIGSGLRSRQWRWPGCCSSTARRSMRSPIRMAGARIRRR
jgi:hypothetical protein